MDNGIAHMLHHYTYDDLGRVEKELLGPGEVRRYTYNIRGQLTGINGAYAETGNKQGQCTFGESLKYDYGFSQPRYDGLVAGMIWRGPQGNGQWPTTEQAYGYRYDAAGRLAAADYRESVNDSSTISPWSNADADYSVSGLTYDLNGNLQAATRRGPGFIGSASQPVTIDRLLYSYNGNQLMQVQDAVTTDYGDGDFQDHHIDGADYAYDADGNLTMDRNKSISNVTYTERDKPLVITFANGNTIRYSYDAFGSKVQEQISTGGSIKRTDYLGNFVYQNDSLQYIGTSAGRTVMTDTVKEEYFVKDHLGNVRSVVDVYQYPIQHTWLRMKSPAPSWRACSSTTWTASGMISPPAPTPTIPKPAC